MVADNDLALGRIVEVISRGKFWKDAAIFVVEDDAQNGSDHVDAHRTVALAISPYTKRHCVDSSLYSTSSMLRTMELISRVFIRPASDTLFLLYIAEIGRLGQGEDNHLLAG